jgi:hypothetical protein
MNVRAGQASTPFDIRRDHYIEILKPIFLPEDPVSHDIIRYFASLLRVLGTEDQVRCLSMSLMFPPQGCLPQI